MENLTQNIIQTAHTKFIQFGIRSISIDDICNDLRISKKTFYKVFPKKEDLVDAVLQFQSSHIKEKFEKMARHKNAIESLVLIINEVRKNTHDDCSAFHYDLEKYYPASFELINEKKKMWIRESFVENLRQGIAEGFYREDLDIELSSYFHAIIIGYSYNEILKHNPKISKKRMTDFYINVMVRLITNEKGLKYVEENIKKD